LKRERIPDRTATAIYDEVWFSSEPLPPNRAARLA
jgi:hypothetical protein